MFGRSGITQPTPGNNHKIIDWEQFRAFAQTHGDKTQVEMAQLWQGDISERKISRALKKIGFMRKKKTCGYQERDESKPQTFIKQLANQAEETIVGVADSRYESTFRLKLQNSPSSGLIVIGKS
jgi:hypothetical protein